MQYLLIGFTRGDELISPRRVILSEPSENREALVKLGEQKLQAAQASAAQLMEQTHGAYSILWQEAVLARTEVVQLKPGQALE